MSIKSFGALICVSLVAVSVASNPLSQGGADSFRRYVVGGGGITTRGPGGLFLATVGQPVAGMTGSSGNRITIGFLFPIAPGDAELDGDVDLGDYSSMPSCLRGPGAPVAQDPCGSYDLDRNGTVDLADFAVFQTSFRGQ